MGRWKPKVTLTHIYVYAYVKHAWNTSIHSLIHLITVVKILLYQELEIQKCFVLPEGEEVGTNNISLDHRINATTLTLFSNALHDLPSSIPPQTPPNFSSYQVCQLILCANLPGLRDAQRASKILFLGVSVRASPEEISIWIHRQNKGQVDIIHSIAGLNGT